VVGTVKLGLASLLAAVEVVGRRGKPSAQAPRPNPDTGAGSPIAGRLHLRVDQSRLLAGLEQNPVIRDPQVGYDRRQVRSGENYQVRSAKPGDVGLAGRPGLGGRQTEDSYGDRGIVVRLFIRDGRRGPYVVTTVARNVRSATFLRRLLGYMTRF